MAFNSTVFLFLFLPLLLLVVFPLPRGIQNIVLLCASVFFYVWGAGWQVLWIGFVAIASFIGARALNQTRFTSSRIFFALLVALALSPLLLLKYLPTLNHFGMGLDVWAFVLPLGISFFTFHAVSYLVDVKRGSITAENRASDYFLYLFYFPHQIAGPIVRYSEIVDDIKHRPRPEPVDVVVGLARFGWGLAKKLSWQIRRERWQLRCGTQRRRAGRCQPQVPGWLLSLLRSKSTSTSRPTQTWRLVLPEFSDSIFPRILRRPIRAFQRPSSGDDGT